MDTLIGNVVADPELRYTPNGKAVASFRLAVNNRAKNEKGVWVDVGTDFHDVTVWQALAEHVDDSVEKGTRVIVVGDFREREWETPEGEKKTIREFVAQDVGLSLKWTMR